MDEGGSFPRQKQQPPTMQQAQTQTQNTRQASAQVSD